jgi:hypothetical protein
MTISITFSQLRGKGPQSFRSSEFGDHDSSFSKTIAHMFDGFNTKYSPKVVGKRLQLLLRIRKVAGLNLGSETRYPG